MDKRATVILVVAGLLCIGLLGAAAQVTRREFDELRRQVEGLREEVRTKRIIVVDDQSRRRGELAVTERGPELILSDEQGRHRAALAVIEDVPGLALWDKQGKPRAALTAHEAGPGLSLYDEQGKAIRSAP